MPLMLQKEHPADSDLFRGESHNKVARKMTEVIRTSDINIIGLEGELGSGKSTIIQLIKKDLSDDYTFIEFDAERYHHGNTKKALIEVIHRGIHAREGVDKESLNTLKHKALGNIVEYDKKVSSRLSWWTVSFILCCLLAVQMVRYLLVDINSYLVSGKITSWWVLATEITAILSPGVLLLSLRIKSRTKNKVSPNVGNIITVGDLFKQNSVDRISETWLVSKEIGTIELTDALSGFTESPTVPADARFILIIDNLDRISADKVKELWSDMELIAGTTHKQFRIIVPYSARHVAKSLMVEGHSGREFIAKRIPVTFTVPPLITAGWQDAFREMWKQTVDKDDGICCTESIQLLECWRPSEYPRITPRLLKKLVNDIHILDMTVPAGEPLRHVLLALYILVVRYSDEVPVTRLLEIREQDQSSLPVSQEEDRMYATQAQLGRIFSHDTRRWSEFLMSIHFQTDSELARTELFDTPLTDAVKNHDAETLEKLSGLYGFSHAWHRCAGRFTMQDWMETVIKLPDDALSKIREEITGAVARLNTSYALSERENLRESFSKSLTLLKEKGYVSTEDFMIRQKNHVIKELDTLQKKPENDDVYIKNLLQEADFYSALFEENLLQEIENDLNGYLYSRFLLDEKDNLPNLSISTLLLSEAEQENMLRHLLESESHDIFHPNVIRFFRLSTKAVESLIQNKGDNFPENITGKLTVLRSSTPSEDIKDLRYLIFTPEWYEASTTTPLKKLTVISEDDPEEYAAHMVAHLVATKNYSEIPVYGERYEDDESYIKYLSFYFRYMKDFSMVMDSLKDPVSSAYVSKSLKVIFKENHLNYINTIDYITTYYPVVKSEIEDVDYMRPVIDRDVKMIGRITEENIGSISTEFLEDLFFDKRLLNLKEKLYTLSQDIFSGQEQLYSAFKSTENRRSIILSRMASAGNLVHMTTGISLFANWYRSLGGVQLKSSNSVRLIWSFLEEKQRAEIIKELHDILMEVDTSKEKRVKVIHDFQDVIQFTEPEGNTSRRAIAALFSIATDDEVLRSWLDAQQYTFSNWPLAEAETVSQVVNENQEKFPGIISRSRFIRNRLPVPEVEPDATNTEDNQDET
ncbi:P-loop NTPase fold protein [Pantoea ananatis]|uniref:P-loop NTPase fold protein n=2 Tax=Pantoea ananas TaxID=553 RepID=UPI000D5E3414|nr:P-loop NTPase fold protein [Pantoea ananatis]PVY82121.1 KAP-like P-loop domain-containing protein [Pantoea ananatis]